MKKFKTFLPHSKNELRNKLNKLIQWPERSIVFDDPYFSAELFHVQESSYFLNLPLAQKNFFLKENSKYILNEAMYIEQAGVAYAQRMGAFAESQEERYFYAQVAREEMEHLRMIIPYASEPFPAKSSFAQIIGEIVETEKAHDAILLIQILLEGWGLHYYSDLAKYAQSAELKSVLLQILKDESRHHGGGLVLFSDKTEKQDFIDINTPKLKQVLSVIQIGPFQVGCSLAQVCELDSLENIYDMLFSLEAVERTQDRLNLVEKILMKVLDPKTMSQLRNDGCFTPASFQQMASAVWNELNDSKDLGRPKEIVI